MILRTRFGEDDPALIAAAVLHDTVEDTDLTLEDIKTEFGEDVAALVAMVTDVSRPEDGNRAARKAKDREHLSRASVRGKNIKLADIIDNTQDIGAHDRHFCKVYLPEMARVLEVLSDGDFHLRADAYRAVAEAAERHEITLG